MLALHDVTVYMMCYIQIIIITNTYYKHVYLMYYSMHIVYGTIVEPRIILCNILISVIHSISYTVLVV